MGYHANSEKSVMESLNSVVARNERLEIELADVKSQLAESQRQKRAAVEDLQAFVENPCAVCAHLQDQPFCYSNCQNLARENYRAWQWRGPQTAKEETKQ